MPRLVIVDYGAGNLRSVTRAVERVGYEPLVTSDPRALDHAEAVIVPGVGAAADTMRNLAAHGMVEPIRRVIAAGRPFLGVCMGMQALFTSSDEDGGQQCLGIIPGTVRRFPAGNAADDPVNRGLKPHRLQHGPTAPPVLKVPHMGWNNVVQRREHYIFRGIPDGAYFYFVHSFHAQPDDPDVVIGETEYGRIFPAIIARDNVVATQFHPEKSSDHGLRIYANFLNHALGRTPRPRVLSAE